MITLIFIVLVIVGLVIYAGSCDSSYLHKKVSLTENSIIKKFNRLLKTIGQDNFSAVKEKLLNTLDQYSVIKKQQFAENLTYLKEAQAAVSEQLTAMSGTLKNKEVSLRAAKDSFTEEEGARLVYELENYELMQQKLTRAQDNLRNKMAALNSKIVQFEGSLALRRAQIVSMIAESISIDNHSFVDLRLDSLEKEFKHEVTKIESMQEVNALTGGKTPDEHPFDLEKYKKLFREFK